MIPTTEEEKITSTSTTSTTTTTTTTTSTKSSSEESSGQDYHFFPAESEESKEKYKQQQLNQVTLEEVDETQLESEDDDVDDQFVSAMMDLATTTWTQDPYRDEDDDESQPDFDIDYSKDPALY